MKFRNLILYTILTASAPLSAQIAPVSAPADINATGAPGYLARARAMYADRNYTGCLDQLTMLRRFNPTPAQQEMADYLRAVATLHTPGGDDALQLLQEFLAAYPSSTLRPQVHASVGDYYFTRGKYSEAYAAYTAFDISTLTGDEFDDALYRRSYSALMLAQVSTAQAGFGTLASRPGRYRTAARFYMGYIAYAEGDYTEAMRYLPDTTSDPELGPAALYYIAQIDFMQGRYREAAQRAEAALKTDAMPQFAPEANRIAGESWFNLGDESRAIPYLRRYLATTASAPKPSASYILGVAEFRLGEYDRAISALGHASEVPDAMGQSANLFLGQAYVEKGNTDAALMAFEKAYRMNYDREVAETALYNYAVAKSQGGRVPFGNSVALFESFLSQYPQSRYAPEVQDYIVTGYLTDNNYEGALRAIEAMRRPSAEALDAKQRALFALGTRDYAAGRYTAALSRFQGAASTGSDKGIARQSLLWQGNTLYELERYDQAIKAFNSFLRQTPASDPNAVIARYDLGYAEFAEGNYDAALTQFRKVIDARPTAPGMLADAYSRAADCHYYRSDFSGAADLYDRAYQLNPDAGDYALYQQAIMQGLQRDHKGKIARLDRLAELFPSSGLIPAAMLEKAESYAAVDDSRSAIATYNKLIADYPSSPYARKGMLQLAIAYRSSGRAADAENAYRNVISTYPTSEEARLAADDLKRIYADAGQLDRYTAFISSIPDAPQTDPSELDALAFRSAEADYVNNDRTERLEAYLRDYPRGVNEPQALYLLARAASDAGDNARALDFASQLTERYPDSESAADVLLIKADAEHAQGKGEEALASYRRLALRTSSAQTLRQARLGVMRTAAELADYAAALEAADQLLASSATTLTEAPEVRYTRAVALNALGRTSEAMEQWSQLASDPSELYGSRAAVSLAEAYLAAGDNDRARSTADALINANPPHSYWLARAFIVLSDALRAQGDNFEADEYLRSLRNNYPGKEAEIFQMIDSRLN